MSESKLNTGKIGSKGTSELCFQRKSHFRGSESVVKDNLVIPCLDMCSHCLREHFWCLLQTELCLWFSLNRIDDSSRKCPRRTGSKIVQLKFGMDYLDFCKIDLNKKFLVPEMNIQNLTMCLYGAF